MTEPPSVQRLRAWHSGSEPRTIRRRYASEAGCDEPALRPAAALLLLRYVRTGEAYSPIPATAGIASRAASIARQRSGAGSPAAGSRSWRNRPAGGTITRVRAGRHAPVTIRRRRGASIRRGRCAGDAAGCRSELIDSAPSVNGMIGRSGAEWPPPTPAPVIRKPEVVEDYAGDTERPFLERVAPSRTAGRRRPSRTGTDRTAGRLRRPMGACGKDRTSRSRHPRRRQARCRRA
jgi:hypothetical protein